MIKYIFLTIAISTLFLNIFLTYYLIRNKDTGGSSYTANREIVSFDLSYNGLNRKKTEATAILDTEVIIESNKKI